MSENCDVTVIFWIYGQFGAIRKPDSGRRVCKTYVFINSNLLSYNITILLWVKVLFLPIDGDFLQKNADINKIKMALVLKGIFSETK